MIKRHVRITKHIIEAIGQISDMVFVCLEKGKITNASFLQLRFTSWGQAKFKKQLFKCITFNKCLCKLLSGPCVRLKFRLVNINIQRLNISMCWGYSVQHHRWRIICLHVAGMSMGRSLTLNRRIIIKWFHYCKMSIEWLDDSPIMKLFEVL